MWKYIPEDELYHHGIKGMKWGVRRTEAQLARARQRAEDKAKKKEMKKAVKNRRLLSDDELQKRINRIEKEKKLRELTAEEITPGKKAASEVLSSAGKKAATSIATGAILYGVKAAMTKKFDVAEAAGYMTPKPKNK